MSHRVVCDASALVALLMDGGEDGKWVVEALDGADLAAPSIIEYETANVIRRHELGGLVGPDQAAQAHADLLDLTIEQWPYELLPRAPGSYERTCRSMTRATSPSPSSRARRS